MTNSKKKKKIQNIDDQFVYLGKTIRFKNITKIEIERSYW